MHAEEGSVHLASNAEDEGGEGEWVKEWVKGGWVEGAVHGVEWLKEGRKTVGGGDSSSKVDEDYEGKRLRGGGCRSSILEGSLGSFIKVGVRSGEDCGSSVMTKLQDSNLIFSA